MSLTGRYFLIANIVSMIGCQTALAQSGQHAPILITKTINNNQRVILTGNVRSQTNAANDLGRVADNLPMPHMLLQLQRSAQQQQSLEQFLSELQDPASPNYHNWLTATQFGQQFGLAQQDIDNITQWLQSQGFTVNTVYRDYAKIRAKRDIG